MKKLKFSIFSGLLFLFCLSIVGLEVNAQEKDDAGRLLVLREAKQHRKTSVAVEAYLLDNILEATVIARMDAAKPRIFSVIIVGPKLGRVSAKERKTLFSAVEDEETIFSTEDKGAFIRFSKSREDRELKGTLTRELHKFRIPVEKILPNKRYQLWVKVESMQDPGRIDNFKFDLENFSELVSQK